jgi:ribosomal protein L17
MLHQKQGSPNYSINSGKLFHHWPCISSPEQIMNKNKLTHLRVLVSAALIGMAAGNAMSEEAAPGATAIPGGHTAAPGTGYGPGWYPPRPDRRGYAQPWSAPQRPAPAPGYSQSPPYYPPYGPYRAEPAAPEENPLGAELKQAQEQLATQTTQLETTREQLARLQEQLQAATAALHKAQTDTINAGRQVDTTRSEVDTLRYILCELAARIETRNAALQDILKTAAAQPDAPDDAGGVDSQTAEQAEPLPDPQCSQLTPPPAITSGQRGVTITTQAR